MSEKTVFIVLNYITYKETIKCAMSILDIMNKPYNGGFHFKIFIVENGSTNESYEVLKEFFQNNPLIKILRYKKIWAFQEDSI